MSNTLVKGRSSKKQTTSIQSSNSAVFAAALADFEMKVYGKGHSPLYDLVTVYGQVGTVNTLDSAFQSFAEARDYLAIGEAGFNYSEQYKQFTLALKVDNGGIMFCGLLHDKDGSPRVDETLVLCRVKANRDFAFDDEVIIQEGEEFLKALPDSYLSKMSKAA